MIPAQALALFGQSRAPDGSLVRDNFETWFGESKVVDGAGGPLRVFHGTCAETFSEFRASPRGSFGSGIYFTSDPFAASVWSGETQGALIMPVFLHMARPYCHQIREPEEVDSWGEGLVKEIFPSGVANALIRAALGGDGEFGAAITQRLRNLGHDGLIATYSGGPREFVVFDSWQVKSSIGNSGLFSWESHDMTDTGDGEPRGPREQQRAA